MALLYQTHEKRVIHRKLNLGLHPMSNNWINYASGDQLVKHIQLFFTSSKCGAPHTFSKQYSENDSPTFHCELSLPFVSQSSWRRLTELLEKNNFIHGNSSLVAVFNYLY